MDQRAQIRVGFVIGLVFVAALAWSPEAVYAQRDLKVGFVTGRGADAAVEAQALALAEIEYQELTAQDYKLERLLGFDVIGVGVVAYDQNEDLKQNVEVVKDYIKSGGYLVTLDFQQDSTWKTSFLPVPLTLFDDDLEEAAGVELIDHPIWQTPNEITEENFIGWGAGDFMADGPHEAKPPWEPLLISGGWPVVAGAPAGKGYIVFNSLQTLQALGRTSNEKVAEVVQNYLFWRGPLAVHPEGKVSLTWGQLKEK